MRQQEPVMICEVCGKETGRLGRHLLVHRLTQKEYYDKYISSPPKCKNPKCSNESAFQTVIYGYKPYCSWECSRASKYTCNSDDYPIHYDRFDSMIQRARTLGYECEFEYTDESFSTFIQVIGPVPTDMDKPTVGRYDHAKGYVFDKELDRWNFRWQSKFDNTGEMARRTNHTHGAGYNVKVQCLEHDVIGNIAIMNRWHRECTLVRLE
jgi:hypothetical protein